MNKCNNPLQTCNYSPTTINDKESNSEACALELLENIEKMFSRCLYSDIFSTFNHTIMCYPSQNSQLQDDHYFNKILCLMETLSIMINTTML